MPTNISEQKKNIESLIKKKSAEITRFKEKILESNKRLEDLKRKKLELEKIEEKEKKFESNKKNIIEAVEEEGKIDNFITFHEDVKEKAKALIKEGDWKKIKEVIGNRDKEILNLQKKLESLEKEYAKDSQYLEDTNKSVKEKKEDLDKAFDEIERLPLKIKSLKQELQKYKELIKVTINKKEKLKMAFYIDEMGKAIQEIEDFLKSKDTIVKRLERKSLEEAQKINSEAKNKFDETVKKLNIQRDILETNKKTRELNILKKIEAISS